MKNVIPCFGALLALSSLSHASPGLAADGESLLEHQSVRVQTSEGLSLAAYVSRPEGSNASLPAIFLTQWVSCGSIAPDPERTSTAERLALAAGYSLIRVDRAGSGESEGPGCDELDYDTEVRHYREALDQLADHPWIDDGRIVIYGSSLGSTTAPLVAQGKAVAGVVVQGAGALTYFERMLHFDRIQLEREPDFDPEAIDRQMRRRIEFQSLYLHAKMTPDQIAESHPHLADIWASLRGTDTVPHYGRPYAWHWQAADQDWLAAWAKIDAAVMVVFGEFEQFESRHGHRAIVDTINRLRPGTASWLELPATGHSLGIYPDQYAAYSFEDRTGHSDLFIKRVSAWLKQVAQGSQD